MYILVIFALIAIVIGLIMKDKKLNILHTIPNGWVLAIVAGLMGGSWFAGDFFASQRAAMRELYMIKANNAVIRETTNPGGISFTGKDNVGIGNKVFNISKDKLDTLTK